MTPCQNCGEREAESQWAGEHRCGLCAARMGYDKLPWWCERCMLESQIAYHERLAAKLPELRSRLEEISKGEPTR